MKTGYISSGKQTRARFLAAGGGRWLVLGVLAAGSVLIHDWFRQAASSPWLALSGTFLVLALALLPLKCQLGRCR